MNQEEWRDRVIRMAIAMVEKTQPELLTIAENAVREHGVLPIDAATAMQFARVLNQVQDGSFLLGLKLGMRTVVDALERQKPKKKEANIL